MNNCTLFSGCSYTSGSGFDLEHAQPELWVNLLHNNVDQFKNTTLVNVSRGGRSNAGIFQDTVTSLLKYNVKYALVAWTDMPRYELDLGCETYISRACFAPAGKFINHNLHDIVYPKEYLEGINNRFTALANVHREIVNLLVYVNTLIDLAKLKNCKIFFINALCPWDDNYFSKLDNVLPNQFTKFTQDLLHTNTRSDQEVFEIYNKIHNEYAQTGGIHQDYWLNLNHSMRKLLIDVNGDGIHPGIKSNQLYYQLFVDQLTQKI